MNLNYPLIEITIRIFAISIFIQNIELLVLSRNKFDLRNQSSILFSTVILSILASIIAFIHPHLLLSLPILICLFIQFVYFEGLYNGGSTSMSHQVAIALSVGSILQYFNQPITIVLYYIGVQAVLSYWVAGLVKLIEPGWRHGQTLAQILLYSTYQIPPCIKKLANKKSFMLLASWMTILIEVSFPVYLFNTKALVIVLFFMFVFHLTNAIIFGINRFIFAWLTTYPAIYFLALQLTK